MQLFQSAHPLGAPPMLKSTVEAYSSVASSTSSFTQFQVSHHGYSDYRRVRTYPALPSWVNSGEEPEMQTKSKANDTSLISSVMEPLSAPQVLSNAELESPHMPPATERLFYASEEGYLGTATTMICDNQARINVLHCYTQLSPLMVASMNGRRSIVRLLLEHQADANMVSPVHKQTALTLAVRSRLPTSESVVQVLLNAGADPVQPFFRGVECAVLTAVWMGLDPLVELLMARAPFAPRASDVAALAQSRVTAADHCLVALVDTGNIAMLHRFVTHFRVRPTSDDALRRALELGDYEAVGLLTPLYPQAVALLAQHGCAVDAADGPAAAPATPAPILAATASHTLSGPGAVSRAHHPSADACLPLAAARAIASGVDTGKTTERAQHRAALHARSRRGWGNTTTAAGLGGTLRITGAASYAAGQSDEGEFSSSADSTTAGAGATDGAAEASRAWDGGLPSLDGLDGSQKRALLRYLYTKTGSISAPENGAAADGASAEPLLSAHPFLLASAPAAGDLGRSTVDAIAADIVSAGEVALLHLVPSAADTPDAQGRPRASAAVALSQAISPNELVDGLVVQGRTALALSALIVAQTTGKRFNNALSAPVASKGLSATLGAARVAPVAATAFPFPHLHSSAAPLQTAAGVTNPTAASVVGHRSVLVSPVSDPALDHLLRVPFGSALDLQLPSAVKRVSAAPSYPLALVVPLQPDFYDVDESLPAAVACAEALYEAAVRDYAPPGSGPRAQSTHACFAAGVTTAGSPTPQCCVWDAVLPENALQRLVACTGAGRTAAVELARTYFAFAAQARALVPVAKRTESDDVPVAHASFGHFLASFMHARAFVALRTIALLGVLTQASVFAQHSANAMEPQPHAALAARVLSLPLTRPFLKRAIAVELGPAAATSLVRYLFSSAGARAHSEITLHQAFDALAADMRRVQRPVTIAPIDWTPLATKITALPAAVFARSAASGAGTTGALGPMAPLADLPPPPKSALRGPGTATASGTARSALVCTAVLSSLGQEAEGTHQLYGAFTDPTTLPRALAAGTDDLHSFTARLPVIEPAVGFSFPLTYYRSLRAQGLLGSAGGDAREGDAAIAAAVRRRLASAAELTPAEALSEEAIHALAVYSYFCTDGTGGSCIFAASEPSGPLVSAQTLPAAALSSFAPAVAADDAPSQPLPTLTTVSASSASSFNLTSASAPSAERCRTCSEALVHKLMARDRLRRVLALRKALQHGRRQEEVARMRARHEHLRQAYQRDQALGRLPVTPSTGASAARQSRSVLAISGTASLVTRKNGAAGMSGALLDARCKLGLGADGARRVVSTDGYTRTARLCDAAAKATQQVASEYLALSQKFCGTGGANAETTAESFVGIDGLDVSESEAIKMVYSLYQTQA